MDEISVERAVPTDHAAEASLEELLAFERLLFDLSARFANVADEQVIAEIESALKQLLKFLGFDRGVFAESPAGGKQDILCSVVVEAWSRFYLAQYQPGRIGSPGRLRSGRTIVIRSYEDFPQEAGTAAEYYRRVGLRYQLVIPLPVGGRTFASIGFARSALRGNGQTTSSRA